MISLKDAYKKAIEANPKRIIRACWEFHDHYEFFASSNIVAVISVDKVNGKVNAHALISEDGVDPNKRKEYSKEYLEQLLKEAP